MTDLQQRGKHVMTYTANYLLNRDRKAASPFLSSVSRMTRTFLLDYLNIFFLGTFTKYLYSQQFEKFKQKQFCHKLMPQYVLPP